MKSNRDIRTLEKGRCTDLAYGLRPVAKKPDFQSLETRSTCPRNGPVQIDSFQPQERNKKKTMATAPGFPYNPHK
ncbi:hypothetical protein P4C99_21900 [Pontiellaceae bacterium B1224]|nr:hypothetical protein [Pontiellaceae bacterium B1224]